MRGQVHTRTHMHAHSKKKIKSIRVGVATNHDVYRRLVEKEATMPAEMLNEYPNVAKSRDLIGKVIIYLFGSKLPPPSSNLLAPPLKSCAHWSWRK